MARPAVVRAVPPRARPLSLAQKVIYGFGDVLIAVRMSCFQFYLLPFYTDVVLPVGFTWLGGLAKTIGLVWDGINDPLAGHLSDRTRTRLGRRRPFLIGAAVPLGVAFAGVWWVPDALGTAGKFAYLVLAFLVMDSFFSLYATPYAALGAELSSDYHERTQLAGTRGVFHLLGLVLGVAIPGIVLAWYPAGTGYAAEGYRTMGVMLGAGMVGVALVTGLGVREPVSARPAPERFSWRSFSAGVAETLQNPAFRILTVTFAFILLAGGLYQTLIPYAFRHWIRRPDLVTNIPLVYIAATIVSLPLWTRLARGLGKDRALRACMVWAALALGVTPLVLGPDSDPSTTFAFVALAGLGNGGWVILPPSITADVVDWDELHTRQRREGAYFGVWTLVMKFASAIASGIVGVGLQVVGYVPNAEQSATTILGIKLLYGPVPAVFMLVALLTFRAFPLTRARHEELQAALAARRGLT